jgi:hypothetical protein
MYDCAAYRRLPCERPESRRLGDLHHQQIIDRCNQPRLTGTTHCNVFSCFSEVDRTATKGSTSIVSKTRVRKRDSQPGFRTNRLGPEYTSVGSGLLIAEL